MHLAGRTFTVGCRLAIRQLTPRGIGVELAPLVETQVTFHKKRGWGAYMRQTLVPLAAEDIPVLDQLLTPLLVSRLCALESYLGAVPALPATYHVSTA